MVYCPICKSKFDIFEPFGLIERKNAECKNCNSLERHRLLFMYFSANNCFDGITNIKLLHIAPEKFFYDMFSSRKNIEYVPCDLFPKLLFNGPKIKKVDITNIPFKNKYFDVVLCSHVLEHVPDDVLAMSELYRVVKNGGWGIIQVPVDRNREKTYEDFTITTAKEREKAFGQSDHVRCYGKDYKNKLESVGFKVTEDRYYKTFSSIELFQMGIMPQIIYRVDKR